MIDGRFTFRIDDRQLQPDWAGQDRLRRTEAEIRDCVQASGSHRPQDPGSGKISVQEIR